MMRTTAVMVMALAAAQLAATAAAADLLTDALGRDPAGICYRRVYTKEHLAKNPDQLTHAIQLSLAPHPETRGALARLAIRDDEGEVYAIGECFWNARAGLGDDGKPLTATFKTGPGLNCTARASPSWAWEEEIKDGGRFVIDMRDGKAMTIHTQDEIAAWQDFDRTAPAGFYPLGSDDRIFRVDRISADECAELTEQFSWDGN